MEVMKPKVLIQGFEHLDKVQLSHSFCETINHRLIKLTTFDLALTLGKLNFFKQSEGRSLLCVKCGFISTFFHQSMLISVAPFIHKMQHKVLHRIKTVTSKKQKYKPTLTAPTPSTPPSFSTISSHPLQNPHSPPPPPAMYKKIQLWLKHGWNMVEHRGPE